MVADGMLNLNRDEVDKTLLSFTVYSTKSQSTEELSSESFDEIPLIDQLKDKRREITLDQFDLEGWNSNGSRSYVSNDDYMRLQSEDGDEGNLAIVDNNVDTKVDKTKKKPISKPKNNKSKENKLGSDELDIKKKQQSKKISKRSKAAADVATNAAVASILTINEQQLDNDLHLLAASAAASSEAVIADINDEELLLSLCPEPTVNHLIPSAATKKILLTDHTTNNNNTIINNTDHTTTHTITIPNSSVKHTKKRSLSVAVIPQSKRQKTMLVNLKNKVGEINFTLSNTNSEIEKSIYTIEVMYFRKQIENIEKNDDSIDKQLMHAKEELAAFDKLNPKSHPVLKKKRNNLKQKNTRRVKKINGENAAKILTPTNDTQMAKEPTNEQTTDQTTDDAPITSHKQTDTFKTPRVPKINKNKKLQNETKMTQFAKNNIFKSINEQLIDPSQILKPCHYIALSAILTLANFEKIEKKQYTRVRNVQVFLRDYSLCRAEMVNEKIHFQNLWENEDDLELYSFNKKVVNTDLLIILKNIQYNKNTPNVIFKETKQNKGDTEYRRLNLFLQLACKCFIIQHLRAMFESVANIHTFHTSPYMRMKMHQRSMHIGYFLPHDSILEQYYEINESGKIKLQEKFDGVALSIPLFQRKDINYYYFRTLFPDLPDIDMVLRSLKHDVDRSNIFLAKKEKLKGCNQTKKVLLSKLKLSHTTDSPNLLKSENRKNLTQKIKQNDQYINILSEIEMLKKELNDFKGLSKLLQILYATLYFTEIRKVVNFLRFQFLHILSARPTTTLVELISDISDNPGTDGPAKFIDTILMELASLMPQSNNQIPHCAYGDLVSRNIY